MIPKVERIKLLRVERIFQYIQRLVVIVETVYLVHSHNMVRIRLIYAQSHNITPTELNYFYRESL